MLCSPIGVNNSSFTDTYTQKKDHDIVIHFLQVETELKQQLDARIPERYSEIGVKKAMDAIQKEFECCGVNNISDWKEGRDPKIPQSCCRPSVTNCTESNFDGSETLSNYFQKVSLKSVITIYLALKFHF